MEPSIHDELTLKLVKNLQEGRKVEDSARQLYERYAERVSRFFAYKRVPPAIAEELTQDVFFRVFDSIEDLRYEHEGSFIAWLLQIARHAFSNWLRSVQAGKRDGIEIALQAQEGEDGSRLEQVLPDEGLDPLAQLTRSEQVQALHTAIAGLPTQRRRCCELRYIEDLKYREVAERMSISIETVKAHLHQARAALEAALRAAGWTPPGSGPRKGSD